MNILDELVRRMSLLEDDRKSLHARGFPNHVIDNYQFRSCTPLNAFVLQDLQEQYGIEPLLEASLYESDPVHAGVYIPQSQLLCDKILIPYSGPDGAITKIRPHKLGFRGEQSQVFRTSASYRPSGVCIIAESEFKAVAAECFGFSAVGIPGIASMSGRNWDYFHGVMRSIDTKEFIICFDNEIKDRPHHSNFKADWRRRYDTVIYAYAMAKKLGNAGLKCRIATLPGQWMVDGKIDIDMALAQGRTHHQFKIMVENAKEPGAYLGKAPIPLKHRGFVNRRVRRFFYEPKVDERNNCFYAIGAVDEHGVPSDSPKLTNCVIKIKNVYEEIGGELEGVMRDVEIKDEYGVSSKPTPIRSGAMASKGKFKEWLMAQGNFLYYGSDNDLTKIWEHVFSNDDGNVVYLVNRCGYVREFDFYIFANVMFKDGEAIYPDDNGVFWLDEVGFKPNVIHEDVSFPKLATEGDFDMKKFIDLLSNTVDFDGKGMAKALVAWMLSVLFIEDVQKAFKLFPILFMYGQRSSGKTTVMRWLSSFFGQSTATLSLSASSAVGVTRGLGYYSGLPFVVDDWRNDPKMRQFIPLFLGVYNRQSGVKGVKTKFGLQVTSVRAALVIMGEELLPDNALLSRCLAFYMPMYRVKEVGEEIETMMHDASNFIFRAFQGPLIAAKGKIVKKISDNVRNFKRDLPGLDSRIAINFSIIASAYELLIGPDEELTFFLKNMMSTGQGMMVEGDKLHTFAEEFMGAVYNHEINDSMFKFEGDNIFIWVKGACDAIDNYYHRQGVCQASLIIQHFKRQDYFAGLVRAPMKFNSGPVPAVVLNLKKMPETIRNHFESVRPRRENLINGED